jgi:hypothetical protein
MSRETAHILSRGERACERLHKTAVSGRAGRTGGKVVLPTISPCGAIEIRRLLKNVRISQQRDRVVPRVDGSGVARGARVRAGHEVGLVPRAPVMLL